MGMSGTVRMVMTPACRPTGARSCTFPPTLVCAETSLSAGPLLRICRYATVVPGVVGCGTYALAMAIDPVALADAHPVTASAASKAAPAIRSTGVSLRTISGYRSRNRASAAVDGGGEQAERRGAEVEHGLVETLQGKARAPVFPGPLAQLEDLQLAQGVAAVGRVEGGPAGLGQPGGPRPRSSSRPCGRRWRTPAGSPAPAPPARPRSGSAGRRRRTPLPRTVPRRSAPSPR